jgi:hypothetical protein
MLANVMSRALATRMLGIVLSLTAGAQFARAQLHFTEVMHSPRGDDALWEWVEIRNLSSMAIDLDEYVFDDDDDSDLDEANILASNGNTIVPAGGVAILYPADKLEFSPARFTDAWGGGISLIPVDGFTALTPTDAIGLWASHGEYKADMIGTSQPRRAFASAAVVLNYSTGFPSATNGRSLAWKGSGSVANSANWVVSMAGENGAPGPYEEVVSMETSIGSAPVNSVADLANPGIKPTGTAAAGLLITEIMYAPETPPNAGWSSTDFEFVEILNNTAATIDFAVKEHVLDDPVGELAGSNVKSGSVGVGQLGVLFNGTKLTPDDMVSIWGPGNYIPVTPWPSLNNMGGDTVAIWDDFESKYLEEELDEDERRGHETALAWVDYKTTAMEGWPAIVPGNAISLTSLSADPHDGESWRRANQEGEMPISFNALPLLRDGVVDHPGDDVGSPGKVAGVPVDELIGDYNNDGRVDAADYTVWRNNLGAAGSTLHNRDSANIGSVGTGDYNSWKERYGDSLFGSGGLAGSLPVPEPASGAVMILVLCAAASHCAQRRRS